MIGRHEAAHQKQGFPMIHKILTLMRENEAMTIGELASKLGTSEDIVLNFECGRVIPSAGVIEQYSEIFGVPTSSILFFSAEDDPDGILTTKGRLFFADKMIKMFEKLMKVQD